MPENCSDEIPQTEVYYKEIGVLEIVFLVICGVFTLLSLVVFLEEVIYIHKNYVCTQRRNKTYWLLGTFPVYTVTCQIGLMIPTSEVLCDLVASGYMAVSLYAFSTLMFLYYGSKDKMIDYCQSNDKQIALRSPPCCCCCLCLPVINVTDKNLNIIKWFVLQASLLQPVVKFLIAVLWSDNKLGIGQVTPTSANFYLRLIGTVSTLLAMYGIVIIFRMSKESLKHQKLGPKFIMFPLTMLASDFQAFIFGIFARVGWIVCVGARSSLMRASSFHHVALLIEMFLLAILMRFAYRKPDGEDSRSFCLSDLKNPTENTNITIIKQPQDFEDNLTYIGEQ